MSVKIGNDPDCDFVSLAEWEAAASNDLTDRTAIIVTPLLSDEIPLELDWGAAIDQDGYIKIQSEVRHNLPWKKEETYRLKIKEEPPVKPDLKRKVSFQ